VNGRAEAAQLRGTALSKNVELLAPMRIATAHDIQRAVEAARGSMKLGNHTWSHANLGSLGLEDQSREIKDCNDWLLSNFSDVSIPYCAFPFGIPPVHFDVLHNCGLSGLTTAGAWFGNVGGPPIDEVPRWNVPSGVSLRGFEARMRGWLISRRA
jgi:peptidoglycan/xylan/chitin deacetylase (PgdA/CDA1 family)